jgi:hypothetical protein
MRGIKRYFCTLEKCLSFVWNTNTDRQTNSIKIPTETRADLHAVMSFQVTDFVKKEFSSKGTK